ncbi:MAG: WecB/TagA/CpsF family glycosyltransferase [Planctomycetales bacterium]|nr:WecB/TagA/CpsF family glycosyltransferase [Planctomycetales bacterium]NIM07686.1 WecB/TagA/CpsF family glycosyltransferase [Planctomycetales bacterium]NIN07189.1 WecB/TagA/CpsF family glycosyltransferase [Planctomycetales bacterium]NIN76282.1 WecB/TagA/CpsF family glycosyltransferase [Planctomycetales bacterium]NIO33488.1 WecB/TagA/CpsF family glycosyltransferase [Planctomycetales bacterium]
MRPQVSLFGIGIDAVTMPEAVARLQHWIGTSAAPCRYVVTPNVDHTILYQHNPRLRDAYQAASLVLADGMPVLWASRLFGKPLPQRVTGSDLVPALFDASCGDRPQRVFLLGGGPGVAERAAANIHRRWAHVQVVGTLAPPQGFEHDPGQNQEIVKTINTAAPDCLVVGLGAPKQELWVHRHYRQLDVPLALCVGATIDFLAGEKRRAPGWMQRCGLEWLYRCAREPRRLGGRYARDALIFPRLLWQEWRRAASA